jgi:nitronate monooxygenase
MDRRLLDRLGIDIPIVQAPMAGSSGTDVAIAVCEAGGLGSLPCAMLAPDRARADVGVVRQRTSRPVNLNFFVHEPPVPDAGREAKWKERLASYYAELGADPAAAQGSTRAPFDAALCEVVEETKPEVVSFHYGLPPEPLFGRVKATGCVVISSATTVAEARWLQDRGCDAIIAQGYEAGGHRGMFLTADIGTQIGTLALVPQIVDAVAVPVIAAGGIADGRGLAAVLALGAAAAQIGTAYLFTPESLIGDLHRAALAANDRHSVLTNVFTGRPARGLVNRLVREVGPISDLAPAFPLAAGAIGPLRAAAEAQGSSDFSLQNTGQAAPLGRAIGAAELTRTIWDEARAVLAGLAAP